VSTLLVALTGCGGGTGVRVDPPEPADAAVESACDALLDRLPDELLAQGERDIEPADQLSAAWGSPAIVLRCGVPRPEALEPTSPCLDVNGVGWLATIDGEVVDPAARPDGDTVTFTTIGRAAYVEVSVPDAWQPQADALAGLATPVSDAVPEVEPCR
jgi:hypothetical protein